MIGLEKGLLTKTRLIKKKEATRKNTFGRKANGARWTNEEPEEKGAMPKE